MTKRKPPDLSKLTDEELLSVKQSIVVDREKAEAGFLAELEPVNAELDRRALLGRFSDAELETLREALG